ncbi:hypothetical protein AUG19_03975 [archaeon 13_1_20CM_2_54_9]|nr:MAG: hypothetical protein AUG19_03975 [archaeon 13_1_20CM_2_54_9]
MRRIGSLLVVLMTLLVFPIFPRGNLEGSAITSPAPIQQASPTGNYVTTFRLADSNLSLSPVIVYPTPTRVWVLAQNYGQPFYSQILAFTPKPQPRFEVSVSLTGVFVSSSITIDAQSGRIWYGVGKMLAYYDQSTGKNQTVAGFPGGALGYLTVDGRSRVWATLTGANSVGLYDPARPGNTTYRVPTSNSGLQGITATAPDGSIWFAETSVKKLGRLDPNTLSITEYTAPSDVAAPTQLVVDANGVVWYSDHATSDFGSFNPATGEWRKTPVGYCLGDCPVALPNAIALDTNEKLWFSEHLRGVIGEYDSVLGLLTEYTIPLPPSNTLQFPATWWTWPGPDSLIWFADLSLREIGYVNSSVPIPLTISSERGASAFQGGQGTLPVTVNHQGQSSVSLGISTTSFDTRNSQITAHAENLSPVAYPVQATAKFTVGWGASLQSRYVTVTVQNGEIAVSIPVKLTVRTAYLTVGVALGLTAIAVFSHRREKRSNREEENAGETNGSSTKTGEDLHSRISFTP